MSSEEYDGQMRQVHERLVQADESTKAEIAGLIDALDADQLTTLRGIVDLVAEDSDIGHQIIGVISGCLLFKHQRAWSGSEAPWTPVSD